MPYEDLEAADIPSYEEWGPVVDWMIEKADERLEGPATARYTFSVTAT